MKTLFAAASAVALLAVAAPASAETYFNLGYSRLDAAIDISGLEEEVEDECLCAITVSDTEGDLELGAVTARYGWRGGSWFGVEGEASVGLQDDDFTFTVSDGVDTFDASVEAKLKYQLAVFAVATMPVGESFEVFGRVGYGTAEFELGATVDGADLGDSEGSDQAFAYGVGAQWFFSDSSGVRADFTRHDFDDLDEVDMWSISYVHRFR